MLGTTLRAKARGMTLLDDNPSITRSSAEYELTPVTRSRLTELGITLSQLYRLVKAPSLVTPAREGEVRVNGYGLTATMSGRIITGVGIDGASGADWSEWAAERASFGDGDVSGADAVLKPRLQAARRVKPDVPAPRAPKKAPEPVEIKVIHVLDRIHPALRKEIARLAAGDYSRLVIHSATNITVLPEKKVGQNARPGAHAGRFRRF